MPEARDAGAAAAGPAGNAADEPRTPVFHVNSQPWPWRAGLMLADVVDEHGGAGDSAIATALNGRFVPRGERAATALVPGDAVLLFAAIVGG